MAASWGRSTRFIVDGSFVPMKVGKNLRSRYLSTGGAGKHCQVTKTKTVDKTIAEYVKPLVVRWQLQGKPTVLLAVNTPLSTSTCQNLETFI